MKKLFHIIVLMASVLTIVIAIIDVTTDTQVWANHTHPDYFLDSIILITGMYAGFHSLNNFEK